MPSRPIDPDSLDGDDLARWYLRSPDEIEHERQAVAAQRYRLFFGRTDPDPGIERPRYRPQIDIDPGMSRGLGSATKDVDPDIDWVSNGPNLQTIGFSSASSFPVGDAVFDATDAGPNDGHELVDIGNPANRRLRKEYEENVGPWPKTEDGRNYHVAHRRAIADGGTNTLDNIRPMHPDAHIAEHVANGDYARWGRRAGIARAFGGRVASVLGPLGILSDITGMLSGRIRTDSMDNFASDLMGMPSRADRQQQLERQQRAVNPSWKPGDPIVI